MNSRNGDSDNLDGSILFVDDDEFGFLQKIKNTQRPVYLYTKPPTKKMDRQVRSKESKAHSIHSEQRYPAFVIDANGLPIIGIQQELAPDQVVIARTVAGYPNVKEVVVFTPTGEKRDNMPESGKGIDIQMRGYVLKSDLEDHTQKNECFTPPSTDPIFPNSNLKDDIHQTIFGDCFLLSSVLTILNQPGGEAYIREMMYQEGTTVVVRLFDPNTKKPVLIRVQNSIHQENNETTVAHRAPWVHILEKAYAVLALKEEGNVISEKKYSYSDLSFRAILVMVATLMSRSEFLLE